MEEKHIVKQEIVRLYGTPLNKLKAVVRRISEMPGVTPQLMGLDNEFIVAITATSGGEAASTTLCENAAMIIEEAFRDDLYGRGDDSLAHAAAGALIRNSDQLCAATEWLGLLLEKEFETTKRAVHIFDFGEYTYRSKNSKKIQLSPKTIEKYTEFSLEAASELALKARTCANVRYGIAISEQDSSKCRWLAVADKNQTYTRRLSENESNRAGVLAALDLVRRLAEKPLPTSSTLPVRKKANKMANKFAVTAALLSLLFSLLAAGGLYYADKLYTDGKQPSSSVFR